MSYVSRDLFLRNIDKLAASALAGAEEFGRGVGEYWGNQAQSVADSIRRGSEAGASNRNKIKQMADANRSRRTGSTDPLGGEYAVNITNAANRGVNAVKDWGDARRRQAYQALDRVSDAAYGGINSAKQSISRAAGNIASARNQGAFNREQLQAAANANRASRNTDRTPLGGTYAEAITDGARNMGRSIGNWFSGVRNAWNRGAAERDRIQTAAAASRAARTKKTPAKGNGANGQYYAGL